MNRTLSSLGRMIAAGALSLAPFVAPLAAPTLSFSSQSGTLHPAGSQFSVDVLGTGFSDLYAYQFSIAFDPAMFRVVGVTEGPFLQTGGATFFDGGTVDNASGTVGFTLDTLIGAVPGVSGAGVLAHFDLRALASGTSALTFSDVLALDSGFANVAVTLLPGVLAVPEPGTATLLFVAGAALMSLRRKVATAERPVLAA